MATKIILLDETTTIDGAFVVTEKADATEFEKVNLQTIVNKSTAYADDGISSSAAASGHTAKAVAAGDPPQWETSFDDTSNYMTEASFAAASLDVNLKNRTKLLDAQIKINAESTMSIDQIATDIEATADLAAGNAAISGDTLTDAGAGWTIDEFAGKVCVIKYSSLTECTIIVSNTATVLTFDENVANIYSMGGDYKILEPTIITSNSKQFYSCDVTTNDLAIILPLVSANNNRKEIKILQENGSNSIQIVAPASNKIKDTLTFKSISLNQEKEYAIISPHNVSGDLHFDMTTLFPLSAYINGNSSEVELAALMTPLLFAANNFSTIESHKLDVYVAGVGIFVWIYTGIKKQFFDLKAKLIVERMGPSTGSGELSAYFKKNSFSLLREESTSFGGSDVVQTLKLNNSTELEYGDTIAIYVERDETTSTMKILANSTIFIKS